MSDSAHLPLLTVVVPAYDEEASVGETVARIARVGLARTEIIVVDDGSGDRTAERAAAAGARVVRHPHNIGNGAAVKTGIRASRGRVVAFLDGDGQHDPEDLTRLLPFVARYHMVVGARSPDSHASLHRRLANAFYNRFASSVAGFPIDDLTSGFRIMRRADALRFCDMFPNGFSYPTTSTLAFLRSGRTVRYVPIRAAKRAGKSKIKIARDGFEFLLIIIKIATLFSPLRVFLPICSFLFFLGLGRYVQTYLLYGRFTNMSHLLINSAFLLFALGLVSEQVSSIRLENDDALAAPEDAAVYGCFESLRSAPPHDGRDAH